MTVRALRQQAARRAHLEVQRAYPERYQTVEALIVGRALRYLAGAVIGGLLSLLLIWGIGL